MPITTDYNTFAKRYHADDILAYVEELNELFLPDEIIGHLKELLKNAEEKTKKLEEENKLLKENITDHPDFVEAATDWYERHNWMIDEDKYEENITNMYSLQKENEELKEKVEILDELVLQCEFKDIKKLLKENKELKEKAYNFDIMNIGEDITQLFEE